MTYTPGPWKVGKRSQTSVESSEGRGICSTGGYMDNRVDSGVLLAENSANAHLIAAAPDLLEALEHAKIWIKFHRENPGIINHNSYLFDGVCDAAIAKAKGQAQ